MRIVIALGGNALQRPNEKGTPSQLWDNVRRTARLLAASIGDNEVVITHGNGPQVGQLLESMIMAADIYPVQTIDIADAMTQGWLGYLIQTALEEALGFRRRVITLITRVLVDAKDPSFLNPSKPVGRIVSQREAEELSKRYGWKFEQDPRGGYRRVVPSPEPLEVLELPVIERLIKDGTVVIAAGGGGIPLVRQDDRLMPVEAVIDKDLASALLAIGLRADKFVILTDVEGVAINYGRQDQRWLGEVTTEELKALYAKGEFPPGSMGPKVLAAVRFAEATGNPAIIGSLDEAPDVIAGRRGTIVRRP